MGKLKGGLAKWIKANPQQAQKNKEKIMAKKLKPKGKRGMAQVKKLGRTYKTGGFNRIAEKAAKQYGSIKAGEKVAGAIFQKMTKKGK